VYTAGKSGPGAAPDLVRAARRRAGAGNGLLPLAQGKAARTQVTGVLRRNCIIGIGARPRSRLKAGPRRSPRSVRP